MGSLGMCLRQDSNAMHDAATISPHIPFTFAQNAILSSLIIHIVPSLQISVAIDNPSLISSVSCLISSRYRWNYMHAANNVSQGENMHSDCCRCGSHLSKFRDRIQVSRVFRYCGER